MFDNFHHFYANQIPPCPKRVAKLPGEVFIFKNRQASVLNESELSCKTQPFETGAEKYFSSDVRIASFVGETERYLQ